ncbi:GntR family transcriptional regulator [Leptolyngbya sp. NK1-12]|uniref:GntR family transcriptional regulator n=1 Tax=Leptolyngbya sp. NK1-12 TaxID=2547451 RepID=A0AA96WHP3_9CYAN|nr:GntR family transcriptional regulator [Leptolyngbya sp. NK1-12]WNZ26257.1 GntR family transcriptional regulator [Leptolyngbya sp. NK1-12]
MAKLQLGGLNKFPRTTHATVTEHLRQAILLGHLPGGTRLVQAELAEALNVSVTPIREALRELSTQGLIELDAFKGAVVRIPTLSELEEVYEMRAALIPLSVKRGIAQITPPQIQEAEALLDQMEATTDHEQWVDLNRQFHNLLDDATQTTQLKQMLHRLSDLAAIYINLSFSEQPLRKAESEQEHRAILRAYQRKDAKTATKLILNHLNGTLDTARNAVMKQTATV